MGCNSSDSEPGSGKNDDGTNEFETDSEPTVRTDGREVRSEIGIDTPLILKLEAILLAICPDCGDSSKRLLEMSVDWASAHTVQALKLSGRTKIITLNSVVRQAKWDNKGSEGGCRDRDHYQCETRLGSIHKQLLEGSGQYLIDLVNVTRGLFRTELR
jgi:hypothetical protein